MLKDEMLFAWWVLSSTPSIGSIALNKIREQLPNCSALTECSAQDLINYGLKPELAFAWQQSRQLDVGNQDAFLRQGWDKLSTWCQQPECGILMPDEKAK
jgi:hypothetical protein